MRLRLLVASLAALVLAPTAEAKWCVRITASPTRPSVGELVTIRVQTFQPVSRESGLFSPGRPLVLLNPAPLLLAYSPGGEMQNPTLRQRVRDRSIREAKVRFGIPGRWRLRTADEVPVPSGCRGRIVVTVSR